MSTTFFKRLGGHVMSFLSTQQNGNLASVAGVFAAVLVYGGGLAGIPIDPATAAAIVAAVTTTISAGRRSN